MLGMLNNGANVDVQRAWKPETETCWLVTTGPMFYVADPVPSETVTWPSDMLHYKFLGTVSGQWPYGISHIFVFHKKKHHTDSLVNK